MLAVVLGGTVAAVATGCGTSSVTGISNSPTKAPEACTVLTPDIAKSALGGQVKVTRKAQPNPHETQCVYTSSSGGSISALVGDWDFINEFAAGSGAKPVAGVGEQAAVSDTDFVAKKGDFGVDITGFAQSGSFSGKAATNEQQQSNALEESVAKQMLANLP